MPSPSRACRFTCLALALWMLCAGAYPALARLEEGGVSQRDLQPNADTSAAETRMVSLYFRMQGENMLTRETRLLTLPGDKQYEQVIIEALLEGPSASQLELTNVFTQGTHVLSVNVVDRLLTVTLSSRFLAKPVDAPATWESDPVWRREVLLRRKLALLSIVNTITEATDCTAVLLLVQNNPNSEAGERIWRYQVDPDEKDQTQLLAPVRRTEDVLLTPFNTATVIMNSWRAKDWDRLYRFIARSGAARPTAEAFLQGILETEGSLLRYSLSAGTVSADGATAMLTVGYELKQTDDTITVETQYPLEMVTEDGIWKITYETLLRLMQAS